MRGLAEFVISLADLLRLEARHLRRVIVQAGVLLLVSLVAAMVLLLGLAGIVTGVFLAMATQMAAPLAAFLTGVIAIMFAGITLWLAKTLAH